MDNLLLSEIIFTINKKNELNLKYEEIKKSINEIGFEKQQGFTVYPIVKKVVVI